MKALVTGATGFVGRHLVTELSRRGHDVRALVRSRECGLDVELALGDIERDSASIASAAAGCDVVFHCAGAVGDKVTWARGDAVNVEGTRRVALAARRSGVRRFVHVSTLGVYGVDEGMYSEEAPRRRVREPYTDTKIAAEEVVEEICGTGPAMSYRIVRPGMIYGPNDTGMMPRLAEMLRKRVPLLGDGCSPVTLVHVDDVVAAMIAAAEYEGKERIFNVRGPDDLSWAELTSRMAHSLALPRPRAMPLFVAWTIAVVFGALERARVLKRAPLSPFVVKLLTRERRYSIDRLKSALGVEPRVGVQTGVPAAIAALAT